MLDLLWEAPLGAASLLFYRLNRTILRMLYQRYLARHPEHARSWRPISSETLTQPGALPCIMTTGPRWNPHATIAAAGPLAVRSFLTVDAACADVSAGEWTVVAHTFPGHRLVASLGRGTASDRLDLPPGQYIIFLRYYHVQPAARFPAVGADGKPVVSELQAPAGTDALCEALRGRRSWYYCALHWYVFPALKYQRWLPQSWVAQEFLPVGNPETRFAFGPVLRGEELEVLCDEPCLRTCHAYITLYNRASFPTDWHEMAAPRTRLRVPATGFYLARLHARPGQTAGAGLLVTRHTARRPAPPALTAPIR